MKKLLSMVLVLCLGLMMVGSALGDAPAYEYTEEDIFVEAEDGHKIPATLTLPKGADGETFRAVVMLHGNGSNRHEAGNAYDTAAPMMAQAGIATIRFDFMGNGDSEEDYVGFSKDVGVAEAMACYNYIAGLDTVDEGRIGIMGWSMGGGITLLTAARNDVFGSVLTWAGAAGTGGVNEERYAVAQKDGFYVQEYDWRDSLKIGLESFEVDKRTNTLEEVANIKVPVLAINGMEDNVVVPDTAMSIMEASTNEDSMVLLLKGVDHTFNVFSGSMAAVEKTTEATIAWFENTL